MMRLTVVVENFCAVQGLYSEWGYSAWLETPSGNLLLDTGGILHTLNHNLNFLKLELKTLSDVVLSHGHFDHTSGLFDVLRQAPQVRVWAGNSVARERRCDADQQRVGGGGPMLEMACTHFVDPYKKVLPGVIAFVVPQFRRDPKFICTTNMWEKTESEQIVADSFADDLSLLVKTPRGYSLLLGCAHSGLPNIMAYVADEFGVRDFHTVLGGTHLCAVPRSGYPQWLEKLQQYNVKHWRPNHCTGFAAAAMLSGSFDDVQWAGAGTVHQL